MIKKRIKTVFQSNSYEDVKDYLEIIHDIMSDDFVGIYTDIIPYEDEAIDLVFTIPYQALAIFVKNNRLNIQTQMPLGPEELHLYPNNITIPFEYLDDETIKKSIYEYIKQDNPFQI